MLGDYRLPERPLEPPEPKIACTCEYCKDDICVGDEMVEFGGATYHKDCFDDIAVRILIEKYGATVHMAGEEEQ